ncbi:hypothetical protein C8R45DRAFT_1077804, partial [Mycena sanguinolenta]
MVTVSSQWVQMSNDEGKKCIDGHYTEYYENMGSLQPRTKIPARYCSLIIPTVQSKVRLMQLQATSLNSNTGSGASGTKYASWPAIPVDAVTIICLPSTSTASRRILVLGDQTFLASTSRLFSSSNFMEVLENLPTGYYRDRATLACPNVRRAIFPDWCILIDSWLWVGVEEGPRAWEHLRTPRTKYRGAFRPNRSPNSARLSRLVEEVAGSWMLNVWQMSDGAWDAHASAFVRVSTVNWRAGRSDVSFSSGHGQLSFLVGRSSRLGDVPRRAVSANRDVVRDVCGWCAKSSSCPPFRLRLLESDAHTSSARVIKKSSPYPSKLGPSPRLIGFRPPTLRGNRAFRDDSALYRSKARRAPGRDGARLTNGREAAMSAPDEAQE